MVRISKVISILLCVAVLLGTTGCAYNSTNPVLRYASYGGTVGAIPGVIGLAAAGASISDDDDDSDQHDVAGEIGVISLILLGAGYISGLTIGGTIGLFRWIIYGEFEPELEFTEGSDLSSDHHDETVSPDYRETPTDQIDEPQQEYTSEKRKSRSWDESPLAQ